MNKKGFKINFIKVALAFILLTSIGLLVYSSGKGIGDMNDVGVVRNDSKADNQISTVDVITAESDLELDNEHTNLEVKDISENDAIIKAKESVEKLLGIQI